MKYSEKLKDPRWQKKRLEILQRDEFTCRSCFDDSKTLHVHHRYYERGLEPWEYPNSSLITLCYDCHECEAQMEIQYSELLIKTLKQSPFLADQWRELASGIHEMEIVTQYPLEVVASSYAFAFKDSNMQKLIMDKFWEHLTSKKSNPINF